MINCEISLMLNYVISYNAPANQAATFAINDAKLYVPVVTLSTQDIVKLLQQLKSNKY